LIKSLDTDGMDSSLIKTNFLYVNSINLNDLCFLLVSVGTE